MLSLYAINLYLFVCTILQTTTTFSFSSYAANQQSITSQATAYKGLQSNASASSTSSSGSSSVCPAGQSCQETSTTSQTYIPPFNIQFFDGNNTIIGQQIQFPSDTSVCSNLNMTNSVLHVHIFMPSNTIINNVITNKSSTPQYLVTITLISTNGSIVYKEAYPQTFASVPQQIQLSASSNATSVQNAATFNPPSSSPIPIFPTMNGLTAPQLQQVVNALGSINQKFLLQNANNAITVSPLSGLFDADSTSSTPSYIPSVTLQSSSNTSSTPISPIQVQLNGSTIFTFQNASSTFTTQDLQNGLALNMYMLPAGTTGGSGLYHIVGILRTLDATKYDRETTIPLSKSTSTVAPQSPPTTITLNYNATTPQTLLTTSFFNSAISPQGFAICSPLNLRFVISQTGTTINAIML